MQIAAVNKKMSARYATDKRKTNTLILTSNTKNCNRYAVSKRFDRGMDVFGASVLLSSAVYFGWHVARWLL